MNFWYMQQMEDVCWSQTKKGTHWVIPSILSSTKGKIEKNVSGSLYGIVESLYGTTESKTVLFVNYIGIKI